jgi:3-hydroxyisobutyrate dehydrogenase
MSDRSLAFLGTGIMGAPMARNLLQAGFEVRAWNRTREKAEPLADDGATVAASPAEAARGAELVVTMLSDGTAVEKTMFGEDGAASATGTDVVWIQMSTVGVDAAERLGDLAREHGLAYVDAPVLGTKQPAEEGQLAVLASGPAELRERCQPVFDAVGRKTVWIGDAGTGSRLKLVVNAWVLTLVEGAAESLALARALGLDPQLFLDAVAGGGMDTVYLQTKGRQMLAEDFPTSFPLRLAHKDASLMLEAARSAGLELPIAAATRKQFERALELGHGEEDMAATYHAAVESLRS